MISKEALTKQPNDNPDYSNNMFVQFQTWLSETMGIVGCPVNCGYCFLKLNDMTPLRPQQLTSPDNVIKQLKLSPTYQDTIPVHFGSQTDAFSTKENIEYYRQILHQYGESDYQNPLIFITKRRIPNSFIALSKEIPQDVIYYVSYSGLAETGLESNVIETHQRDNFVRLHDFDVPVVHYWRPFTPLNSSDKTMRYILDHVRQYSSSTVINGLRLNEGIKDQVAKYWPELNRYDFDYSTLGEVWPKGIRGKLHRLINKEYSDYPVYFGNTPCSVSHSLHQPDRAGIFNSRMCHESNCNQQTLCETHHQIPTRQIISKALLKVGINPEIVNVVGGMIQIDDNINTQTLTYLRNKLIYPITTTANYTDQHNWANITNETPITEVEWKSQ